MELVGSNVETCKKYKMAIAKPKELMRILSKEIEHHE
jgi:hypothetical protein